MKHLLAGAITLLVIFAVGALAVRRPRVTASKPELNRWEDEGGAVPDAHAIP